MTADARRALVLTRLRELGENQRRALADALDEGPRMDRVEQPHPPGTPNRGQLVAYVTAPGQAPDAEDLTSFLQARLPDYMIPSRYFLLKYCSMIVHFIPCCPIVCHNSCYINAIQHVRAVFTDSLLR